MKNTELIKFLKTQSFTRTQAHNLIIADLFEAVPLADAETPIAQRLIAYYNYKITETLLPVIEQLKEKTCQS